MIQTAHVFTYVRKSEVYRVKNAFSEKIRILIHKQSIDD
jgi:hypothetical protein